MPNKLYNHTADNVLKDTLHSNYNLDQAQEQIIADSNLNKPNGIVEPQANKQVQPAVKHMNNTSNPNNLLIDELIDHLIDDGADGNITDNKVKLLLGLDYGVKKMGMATGNSLTQDAQPFEILAMNNGQPADWDNLIGMIVTWQFSEIVVGHPINMDGSDSMLAKRAHKFARRLAHRLIQLKLPVLVKLFDERLTSVEARTLAWELGLISDDLDPIDDISACLLLNSYLNRPDCAQDVATYTP